MLNNDSKLFILTNNFYKSPNDAAIFYLKKRKPEGKASVNP